MIIRAAEKSGSYDIIIEKPEGMVMRLVIEKYNFRDNQYEDYKRIDNIGENQWRSIPKQYEVQGIFLGEGLYRFLLYLNDDNPEIMTKNVGGKIKVRIAKSEKQVLVSGSVQKKMVYSIISSKTLSGVNLYYTVKGSTLRYPVTGVMDSSHAVMFYINDGNAHIELHAHEGVRDAISIEN